ncbi:MAG TPA: aldolase [Alphaproteobacteria bacterium]|nr:aldolase [Alphaproteobacteria bacterium]
MERVMSEELRQARIDLAAALRLAARFGLHEGICNHFSYMVPGADDRFLINPQGHHWSEIRASDLLLVDRDGRLIEGAAQPEPTAFYIHWRIHRGLPQARAVLHTHMPYATAITTLEDGRLEPISQTAIGFHDRIAYDDDYNGLALDEAEGDRMMRALGNKSILFLANHGVMVTGRDMHCAFDDLYYLERASQLQWLAMSTGRKLRRVPDEVVRKTAQQFIRQGNSQARPHFEALKRLLDREEPDYKS